MKTLCTIAFSLLTLSIFGQIEKGKYLTSGAFQFRNYYEGDNLHKRIVIGLSNKTGYLLAKGLVIGPQIEYTWTHENVERFSSLQQGGSQWIQKGTYNRHDYSIGVFIDKYFKVANKLCLTAGFYAQYSTFNELEVGQILDQNGLSVGIEYETETFPNQVAKVGLSCSAVYFINNRFGLNCLISSLDFVINKNIASEIYWQFPMMKLGIQYHFPK